MSISGIIDPPAGAFGPAAVVADACATLGRLEDELWAAKSPVDLLATNAALEQLRSRLAAVQCDVAAEIDATDAAKTELAWQSPGDYLTATAGAKQGAGQNLLRTARQLTGPRQATREALHAGAISPEQAEVIVKVIKKLPVDPGVRDEAERYLLDQAHHLNATDLRTVGDHLLNTIDPDGSAKRAEKKLAQDERSAHLERSLSIIEDGLGGVRLRGRGTVEDAAVLKAALASLSAPQPNTDPEWGVEGRDLRDHGARTWDALIGIAQKALDTDTLPTDHGMKPRVVVTISWDALKRDLGTGVLPTGETLSASAVRKLACDAHILPMVLGSSGVPLDVGRQQRLVSLGLWLALVARDTHCAFPGCRRPPIACDAHHIQHWADGGPTSLDNSVLLCRAHHTIIHSTAWQVRLNPVDRIPEFKPPPLGRRLGARYRAALDAADGWIRDRIPSP